MCFYGFEEKNFMENNVEDTSGLWNSRSGRDGYHYLYGHIPRYSAETAGLIGRFAYRISCI